MAAVLIFGIPAALLLKAAAEQQLPPGVGEAEGAAQRGGLWAAGTALGVLTVASWAATLTSLAGRQ